MEKTVVIYRSRQEHGDNKKKILKIKKKVLDKQEVL